MFIMTETGWRQIVCANVIPVPNGNSSTLFARWLAMARGEQVDDL